MHHSVDSGSFLPLFSPSVQGKSGRDNKVWPEVQNI